MKHGLRHGRYAAGFLMLPVLLFALVACGFHLRGAYQLPPHLSPLYVDKASMSASLYPELRAALKASGVALAPDPATAASTLRVTRETRSRSVLSVDSAGRAREYELRYELGFSLETAAQALIEDDRLQLQRSLLFDPETVLGGSYEQESLYNDMMRDGAGLMLLRIQAAAREAEQAAP